MTIVSYYTQLLDAVHDLTGTKDEAILRKAFESVGIPSSTFYRAKYGADMKSSTAERVAKALAAHASG